MRVVNSLNKYFFRFVLLFVMLFVAFLQRPDIVGATFNNKNKTDNLQLRFTAAMSIDFSKSISLKSKLNAD